MPAPGTGQRGGSRTLLDMGIGRDEPRDLGSSGRDVVTIWWGGHHVNEWPTGCGPPTNKGLDRGDGQGAPGGGKRALGAG